MYIFYTQLTTYRKYFSLSNRPDMTFAVDCSLKTKLLSIYLVQKAEEDIRGNLFEQHPQRYCLEEDEEEPDRDRGRDFSRTFSDLIQDASAHVHNTRPTTVTDFRVVCTQPTLQSGFGFLPCMHPWWQNDEQNESRLVLYICWNLQIRLICFREGGNCQVRESWNRALCQISKISHHRGTNGSVSPLLWGADMGWVFCHIKKQI